MRKKKSKSPAAISPKEIPLSHETGHFKSHEGTYLYFQSWTPEIQKEELKKGVLIFIHGMAEHSGRYQYPVQYFTSRGYTVYAMDLRGHGKSHGRRAYAESMHQLTEDVRVFVKHVKSCEGARKKYFLVGHSFGGQIVLNYTTHYPDDVDGVLVSSPNLKLKLPVNFIKRVMAPVLSRVLPRLPLGNDLDPSFVSHDETVVRNFERDPHVLRKITAKLGDIVLENYLTVMDLARKYKAPIFMMHAGADLICCPTGTKEFFKRIPHKKKNLKIYKGLYHEIFNELGREKVFRDMEVWIERQ